MTGYEPGASVVDVRQLSAGRVATQRIAPPEVKVTVPVASPARPVTDNVSCEPNTMLAGEADFDHGGVRLGHREARAGRDGGIVVRRHPNTLR